LCPLCDKVCQYQLLKDSCFFAKVTYLFDNPATVFFAIFMSFWGKISTHYTRKNNKISFFIKATTFLELWKRRQCVIAWEWDLIMEEDDQETRPEFETTVKSFRVNPVTGKKEPYLSIWNKGKRLVMSASVVLFMVTSRDCL
jgi:anoctamin-4